MSPSAKTDGQNRMTLLLIAGIPLTMVLAASWLWYFVIEGNLDLVGALGTSNNGTLTSPPRQIIETPFRDDVGAAFAWSDLDPRWTMVVVNPGALCDAACERRLYTTRQIHIALGKEFNRLRRVYITDVPIKDAQLLVPDEKPLGWPAGLSGNALSAYIAQAHQGLVALEAGPSDVSTLFPELSDAPAQWYLVDPAGWVMMRFSDDLEYKAVISDLKFLLKNSGGN